MKNLTALLAGDITLSAFQKAANSKAASAWIGSEGTAAIKPTNDTFYQDLWTLSNLTDYSPGDIIGYRQVGLANYSNVDSAWQIQYRSTDTWGNATASITTVIIPSNNTGENLVSYQIAEDASYLNCAPSYEILTQTAEDQLQQLLYKGWVVNSPDYEGLNSSFAAGIHSGHLTLDSIIAAQNAASEFLNLTNDKVALWGYSGGSLASGWAAELQSEYAPELNITAAAVGGYVVNLKSTLESVNKGAYAGFIPAGMLGLASEYTGLWDLFYDQVPAANQTKFQSPLKQCLVEYIITFLGDDIWSFFKDGDAILEDSYVKEILANTTLGQKAPKFPLMVYQGTGDAVVNYTNVDDTVEFYCDQGTDVTYYRGIGLSHQDTASKYMTTALKFLADAFDGVVPTTCTTTDSNSTTSSSSASGSNSTAAAASSSNSTSTGSNSTSAGTGSGSNSTGSSSSGSSSSGSSSGSSGSSSSSSGSGSGSGSGSSNAASAVSLSATVIVLSVAAMLL